MANRGSTTAFQQEIVKDQSQPFHLVEIYLDDETYYLTDSSQTITYSGNEYSAVGHLLGFEAIQETNRLMTGKINVSLSGIDKIYTNLLLTQNYIDRKLIIRKGFLDSTKQVIANPINIFEGNMDNPSIAEDATNGRSIISVAVANQFVDFEKTSGRFTNYENQKLFFPNDRGFEYASEIIKDVPWGSEFDAGTREGGAGSISPYLTGASYIDSRDIGSESFLSSTPYGGILSLLTNYNNRIVVYEAQHGRLTGQTVTISGATGFVQVGANFINRTFQITVLDANSYTVPITQNISYSEQFMGGAEVLINNEPAIGAAIITNTGNNTGNQITIFDSSGILKVGDYVGFINPGDAGGISEEALSNDQGHVVIQVNNDGTVVVEVTELIAMFLPSLRIDASGNVLGIMEADHEKNVGDTVVIAGAEATGGLSASDINGERTVTAVTDNSEYQVSHDGTATSDAVNTGGDATTVDAEKVKTPPISTTEDSNTIVIKAEDLNVVVGDTLKVQGVTEVGGIDPEHINNKPLIVTAVSTNTASVAVAVTATATETGGGNQAVVNVPVKATSAVRTGTKETKIKVPLLNQR
tara:strand:- start:5416 stop:7167 length:1752 start_codon:yes stop_codon:yes gene_type:complete